MLTFVGCALSGLPLLFADKPWAADARAHPRRLRGRRPHPPHLRVRDDRRVRRATSCWSSARAIARRAAHGASCGDPDSMVPQPQDGIDIYRNFKWFIGRGPRPQFDRWTYWEKFDYWAVFWGMFIIGGSGLLLWFPVFFAKFLPGLDVQHRGAGPRRGGAARRRLHLHVPLLQRPPAAGEVPDGHGDLHRAHLRARAQGRARRRVRAPGSAKAGSPRRRRRRRRRVEVVRLDRRRRRRWCSASSRSC